MPLYIDGPRAGQLEHFDTPLPDKVTVYQPPTGTASERRYKSFTTHTYYRVSEDAYSIHPPAPVHNSAD